MYDTYIIDFNAQHSDEKFLEHAKTVLLKKILDFGIFFFMFVRCLFQSQKTRKETK